MASYYYQPESTYGIEPGEVSHVAVGGFDLRDGDYATHLGRTGFT